jgi:Uma2 family endonuclease
MLLMAMTQTKAQKLTFAEFLEYDDGTDHPYDLLTNGELVEVPNEAEINSRLAMALLVKLLDFVSYEFIKINVLELEVQPAQDGRQNRRPDLAILRPEHLNIDSIIKRTALFLGALPPRFVAEVVSPGTVDSDNYQRDYQWKRQQYQDWGIPEYWILDPHRSQVTVLVLKNRVYQAQIYQGEEQICSAEFPDLQVTAAELLSNDMRVDK